jgi:hypothetical protein
MSRVVLCGVLSVACLVGATGCGEPRRPDVIVVTVDTLRADHVGVYADGAETPRIDDLAREGTVFERCAAPMPLTRPAHFSMLTSLYPREHGVLNNAMVLPDEARSLAEILAEHGYRTGGFVGVRLLGPDSGAAQGFERFDQPEESRERRAETVVRRALDWLDRVGREQPRFLWVHVFDPHMPYAPPEPFFGGPEDGLREIGWAEKSPTSITGSASWSPVSPSGGPWATRCSCSRRTTASASRTGSGSSTPTACGKGGSASR